MRDMKLSNFSFLSLFNYSFFQTATSTNLFQGGGICTENHVKFFCWLQCSIPHTIKSLWNFRLNLDFKMKEIILTDFIACLSKFLLKKIPSLCHMERYKNPSEAGTVRCKEKVQFAALITYYT